MPRANLNEFKDDLLGSTSQVNFNDSNLKVFKELLQQVDIIEVLETEYDLFFPISSNGWYNTNCPLPGHDDSSPSFGVNREKGTFHCFGCGASGDLISFIRKMEGLSFKEAILRIMLITGLNPNQEQSEIFRALRNINNLAEEFLNYQVEYNLPGGISPVQFLRSLAERLKNYQLKVDNSPKEIEWVENVYEKADNFIMKEDYSNLNKLWKSLGNEMKSRLNKLMEQDNE